MRPRIVCETSFKDGRETIGCAGDGHRDPTCCALLGDEGRPGPVAPVHTEPKCPVDGTIEGKACGRSVCPDRECDDAFMGSPLDGMAKAGVDSGDDAPAADTAAAAAAARAALLSGESSPTPALPGGLALNCARE